MNTFNLTWLKLLQDLLCNGQEVSPRGKKTFELPSKQLLVDMKRPVLTVPARKLSYKFMAAEAHWMLSGDCMVEPVAKYNPRIAEFSDDGLSFFGAYGPKFVDQLPYVVAKLVEDPDTRQAVMTFWREKPPATKDVPCTVAMAFGLRYLKGVDGPGAMLLHSHVFMRSNDAWLGTPYDVFNFSMLNHHVCAHLNLSRRKAGLPYAEPGTLHLTAASSHLYESNWASARECLEAFPYEVFEGTKTEAPQSECPRFWNEHPETQLEVLAELRESKPGDAVRWWEEEC